MTGDFVPGRVAHIVGVAGAGMSALARLLHERGLVVSGCDRTVSAATSSLATAGVRVFTGHDSTHVAGADVVTASPAVADSHVELVEARELGITVLTRSAVIGELAQMAPVVGVCGTHGKTTTSSMVAHIWSAAQRDPSWLIGAAVLGLGEGGRWRDGSDLIMEVDESYGTFQTIAPAMLGLLNVEADHLDHYGDLAALESAFVALVERTTGEVVVFVDDPGARRVSKRATRASWTAGRHRDADIVISDEHFDRTGSHFTLSSPWGTAMVELAVPGSLNVANASIAAGLALAAGISTLDVVTGLAGFRGAPRRFEIRAQLRGTTIVEDYAHLPGEVAATIAAARQSGYERIAAVFQPHRYTRTVAVARDFAGAFDGCDQLIVTDIYPAGEANPSGLTGRVVAKAAGSSPGAPPVLYVDSLDDAAAAANELVGSVDLLLILGAGDVGRVIDLLGSS